MSDMQPAWLATLDRIPGDGLKGEGFPRNVLGVIMHSADTLGPFLEYWVTCKQAMSLTVREQELVILRMAVLFRSQYVWKHHVPVGAEFGISDAEMDALMGEQVGGEFNARERALLAFTDEMVEQRTVRADVWAAHKGAIDDQSVVDLVHLISQYVLFALMNNVMQVPVESALDEVRSLG
jgi:4-carboxymuconolactone decarboxylase